MPELKGILVVPVEKDGAKDVAQDAARNIARELRGCSVYSGTGMWVSQHGEIVEEKHFRIEATGKVEENFRVSVFTDEAQRIKRELDETEVYTEFQEVDTKLI